MRGHHPTLAAVTGLSLSLVGCALPTPAAVDSIDLRHYIWKRAWYADYIAAEQQASESGKPLLLYYKDAKPWAPDPVQDSLASADVDNQTQAFVRCELLRSYEPDRRYVRQFGVERAPALVLVHADGTYHATTGELNAERILDFLAQAKPPGSEPNRNPYVARPATYDWLTSLDDAKSLALESNRSLLVVLDRPWSRDWERLSPMLTRPEVYSRVREMVHCRPVAIWRLGLDQRTEFEVANFPAVIVVSPNGSHRTLEMPTSYESVVRFLDETLTADAAGSPESGSDRPANKAAEPDAGS